MSLAQVPLMSLDCDFLPVGERIKTLRGALTQAAFADRLGVARKTVVRWEAGEALPDGASLMALLKEFSADPAYLLVGKREAAPVMTLEEKRLLALFRLAEPGVRQAVVAALAVGSAPAPVVYSAAAANASQALLAAEGAPAKPVRIRRGAMSVEIHGDVGQRIEGGSHPGATFTVEMGKAKGPAKK